MRGDERRFWIATAQVLEQLGHVEDVRADAKAVAYQLLHHRRAPAGAAKTRLDWPLVNTNTFANYENLQEGCAA
jgi:hypothetical protein